MPLANHWSPAETSLLRKYFFSEPIEKVAARLNRTPQSCKDHAYALGLNKLAKALPPKKLKQYRELQRLLSNGK